MCLAIPARVVEIRDEGMALVEVEGVRREASLALVEADVDDYVILHVGIAITRLDEAEAERTLSMLRKVVGGDEKENTA
ncbi:MAG TPA: HypC/HybG/HupF family hydrogenase formation chaperone [Mariprofundaceae bacterium]|nr:HypC/HybG/HupF family hydrogenase formation chaperone [Mariprofundaceae bacterium]